MPLDILTIRRQNLEILIDEAGSQAELARRSGADARYISQIYTESRTPTGAQRKIGDELARRLEKGMNKPLGWMDQRHTTQGQLDDKLDLNVKTLSQALNFIDEYHGDIYHTLDPLKRAKILSLLYELLSDPSGSALDAKTLYKLTSSIINNML